MGITTKRHQFPQIEPERRRRYITDLDRAISGRNELACGIVRAEDDPALNVIRFGSPRRSVEVTAVDAFGRPWFAWAADGELIGTVDDVEGVAYTIDRELRPAGPS